MVEAAWSALAPGADRTSSATCLLFLCFVLPLPPIPHRSRLSEFPRHTSSVWLFLFCLPAIFMVSISFSLSCKRVKSLVVVAVQGLAYFHNEY